MAVVARVLLEHVQVDEAKVHRLLALPRAGDVVEVESRDRLPRRLDLGVEPSQVVVRRRRIAQVEVTIGELVGAVDVGEVELRSLASEPPLLVLREVPGDPRQRQRGGGEGLG